MWVNRATLTARRSLPVFPDKQTCAGSVGMCQNLHKPGSRSIDAAKEKAARGSIWNCRKVS
jgi:hypothetical protein